MFRPNRKEKKEISIEETKKLLLETRIGVIAVNGDDGYPYAVPVNYYYDDKEQKIFFHGSKVGHKADSINKCDKVSFTVMGPEVVKDEEWAPYVKSAVVFGRCHIIEDIQIAQTRLRQFAMKYYPDEALVEEEIATYGKAVQMFVIDIEHISGKEIQER